MYLEGEEHEKVFRAYRSTTYWLWGKLFKPNAGANGNAASERAAEWNN